MNTSCAQRDDSSEPRRKAVMRAVTCKKMTTRRRAAEMRTRADADVDASFDRSRRRAMRRGDDVLSTYHYLLRAAPDDVCRRNIDIIRRDDDET